MRNNTMKKAVCAVICMNIERKSLVYLVLTSNPVCVTSVTSTDACAMAQHVCVCVSVCVISVFSESRGPCFPCGALVLVFWGGCRSCHYK